MLRKVSKREKAFKRTINIQERRIIGQKYRSVVSLWLCGLHKLCNIIVAHIPWAIDTEQTGVTQNKDKQNGNI